MPITEINLPKTDRGNDPGDNIGNESYSEEVQRLIAQARDAVNDESCEEGSGDAAPDGRRVGIGDFYAHMPTHTYIFAPTRDLWPASSVDARLPRVKGIDGKMVKASRWIDQHQPVEQMTWSPGDPLIIKDRLIDAGGWVSRKGVAVFNLYRGPTIGAGDPASAGPWIAHLEKIYPEEAEHIIRWCAQRVQTPGVKVNHALVLGGAQGIGKDTIIEPVKHAVGPWNAQGVSPTAMIGRFNGFVQSVIIQIDEARDLGDMDRFAFYDHTKIYIAAPPTALRCDQKNLREFAVPNVCGVIVTTNHKSDGIYLPADDRRHFVAWSDLTREDFTEGYWRELWGWYESGGMEHVAAYLRTLDISDFDPKAPPRQTDAFWHIVNSTRPSEDGEIADLIELMGNPNATTLEEMTTKARAQEIEIAHWLSERRNRRIIPHRLEQAGYEPVRSASAKDGLWKVNGKRQVIYARRDLSQQDRIKAAGELAGQ